MEPGKNKPNKASMTMAQAIINEYQPQTAADMQADLKDIFTKRIRKSRI